MEKLAILCVITFALLYTKRFIQFREQLVRKRLAAIKPKNPNPLVHIAVLDYAIGEVFVYTIPSDEDIEKWLKQKHHKHSQISYMISDNHIQINYE